MCGLAGIASVARIAAGSDQAALARMLDALDHRGPDDRGRFFGDHVALGHDRLSIIDLSPRGRQPMATPDGAVQIVFNGEIYNFPALRAQLAAAGHPFVSQSDTEVLIHGYAEWGLSGLLDRIEGMFAFALWDATRRRLFLARDQFGIKPLFYARRGNRLIFASEPKALVACEGDPPAIDGAGLLLSFQHIGIPAPATIFEGYRQLEPGTWLGFDADTGRTEQHRYWSWRVEPQLDDPEIAVKLLWETLLRSVEMHLIADVPVGILLSGGLDSSLIAAACAELGRKPTCLTIALPDSDHDESGDARDVCEHFGLPHWVEAMRADDAPAFDGRLAQMFDEPFASSAALSAAYVAQIASRRFKVMLSGDGGDELFGGYRWYRHWSRAYGAGGKRAALWRQPADALRALRGRGRTPVDPMEGYAKLMGGYPAAQMAALFDARLLERHPEAADAARAYRLLDDPGLRGFDRLQALDVQLFLPAVCLTKMDRTSMAFGLEVRVPLLTKAIAGLAGRIAQQVRNPRAELKGLLKRLAREKLPERLLHKRKQGFSTPVRRWFPAPAMLEEMTRDRGQAEWWRGVFAPDALQAASRLEGRSLWRFWHTWRWVKRHARSASLQSPAARASA